MIECNYERGEDMTTEEIVQNYQVKLLKIIFKEIDSLMKKKEKADINAQKLAENGYSVRIKADSSFWRLTGIFSFTPANRFTFSSWMQIHTIATGSP